MQDIQNIPNPDVNTNDIEDDFGNHPETGEIPLPPTEPTPAPVEEPPGETDDISIDEPRRKPSEIV